jgi:small Trp-rich protein
MSEKSSSSSSSGIGFTGLLTIVFIVLKLLNITEVANWSWWWVISPIWIVTSLVIGFIAITFAIIIIAEHFKYKKNRKSLIENSKHINNSEPYRETLINSPKSKFLQKLEESMINSKRTTRDN